MRSPSTPQRRPAQAPALARTAQAGFFDSLTAVSVRRFSPLYSNFVTLLKLVLPAAALALVALVLLWPQLNPLDQRFRLKPVSVGIEDLENLRMLNPRYLGTDKQNQPYTLIADQATQQSGDSNVTDLVKPKGDITLKKGTWLALSAEAGTYRKQDQLLDLEGNVNLFHDQGYELVTARARINLELGTAAGDDPVAGQGPDMELQGQGFRVYDRGDRVLVTGKSRLVLHPAAKDPQ